MEVLDLPYGDTSVLLPAEAHDEIHEGNDFADDEGLDTEEEELFEGVIRQLFTHFPEAFDSIGGPLSSTSSHASTPIPGDRVQRTPSRRRGGSLTRRNAMVVANTGRSAGAQSNSNSATAALTTFNPMDHGGATHRAVHRSVERVQRGPVLPIRRPVYTTRVERPPSKLR